RRGGHRPPDRRPGDDRRLPLLQQPDDLLPEDRRSPRRGLRAVGHLAGAGRRPGPRQPDGAVRPDAGGGRPAVPAARLRLRPHRAGPRPRRDRLPARRRRPHQAVRRPHGGDQRMSPARTDIFRFALIWTASLLSSVGSSLTTFVLGVWVYQSTGSPTQFALVVLSGMLPGILIGPFAGVVVDRFDRRRVMILTDSLAAVATVAVALLIWTDALAVWHVALAGAVGGACGVFHLTAYQAMTPLLIPERHLGRANGLMHLASGIQIAAPVLGATLLATVGMIGVVGIDLTTFGVAMMALLFIRLPAAVLRPNETTDRSAVLEDLGAGWRHLRAKAGLTGLVAALTGFNFTFAVAGVLVQPLILSFAGPGVLGVLMFAGGAGMLAGGLVMGAWGGPKRKIVGMTAFMGLGGVF